VTGNVLLGGQTSGVGFWASLILNLLLGAVLRLVGAIGLGVIYGELRGAAGAFDARRLSDVFA
jgi:hypothetical protein